MVEICQGAYCSTSIGQITLICTFILCVYYVMPNILISRYDSFHDEATQEKLTRRMDRKARATSLSNASNEAEILTKAEEIAVSKRLAQKKNSRVMGRVPFTDVNVVRPSAKPMQRLMNTTFTQPMNSFRGLIDTKTGSKAATPPAVELAEPIVASMPVAEPVVPTSVPATRTPSLAEVRALNAPEADSATALVRSVSTVVVKEEGGGRFRVLVKNLIVKGQPGGVSASVAKKMKQAASRARKASI